MDILIIIVLTIIAVVAGYYFLKKNRSLTIEDEIKASEAAAKEISIDELKSKIMSLIEDFTREDLYDKGYKTAEEFERETKKREIS